MRVIVTAEHIRDGRLTAPRACPLALAIAEAYPGTDVTVFYYQITVVSQDTAPHNRLDFYLLGRRALALIEAFDRRELTWETTPDETRVYIWTKNRVTEWLNRRGWQQGGWLM